MNGPLLYLISALGLTSFATLFLGVLVSILKWKSRISTVFLLYSLSIAWWSFLQILLMTSTTRANAIMWARIMEAGAFFIPAFFVHFVALFLELKTKRWILPGAYACSFIIAGLCMTTYMVNDAVPKLYFNFMMTPGPLFPFALLFFLSSVVYGNYELYKAYTSSSGLRRNQLAYLFWSSLLGYIGGSANFFFVYDIDIPVLNPFGTYAIPLYF